MIQVADIITQFRINNKDVNEVKWSNWDIVNALNEALRLISNDFAMRNTDFLEKSIKMLDDPLLANVPAPPDAQISQGTPLMGQKLPTDFVAEVMARRQDDGYKLYPSQGIINEWNYLIYQDCIFAMNPIVLKYRFSLPKVSETDSIDLPISFFDFLIRSVGVALGEGGLDGLTQFITDNALKLIPSRRYANARVKLPWRV